MNILITGANGQLGSEFRELAKNNTQHNFIFTDLPELDICNYNDVLNKIRESKINILVNCAAYTAVDKAESDSALAQRVNAEGPGILAKASNEAGAKIIHVSTDFVFDGSNNIPYTEDMPTVPLGIYGATKLEGEQLVQKNNSNSAIVRTAWLYSAYGNNFVKTMIRLGREREELGVIFDQTGTPTWAADLAAAILVMANSENFVPGIYHYSNEGVASWYDFTLAIHEMMGINCMVKPIETHQYPTPAKRPHFSVLNKAKIKNTFHIEIPYWRDSLKKCLENSAFL